jgi:hypothetical protein
VKDNIVVDFEASANWFVAVVNYAAVVAVNYVVVVAGAAVVVAVAAVVVAVVVVVPVSLQAVDEETLVVVAAVDFVHFDWEDFEEMPYYISDIV